MKKSVDRKRKWWWCSANCVIIWESISLVWIFRKYVHLFSWTCAYFLLFSVYSSVKCSLFPLQTTCCFATNDVLFTQNDVLFLWKWICFCLAAVTLVTAKKQKSCRMRACYARVYVCVARGEDLLGITDSFCCECVAKMWVGNLETPFFCWFFTLLPHIYPYSIRGRK